MSKILNMISFIKFMCFTNKSISFLSEDILPATCQQNTLILPCI